MLVELVSYTGAWVSRRRDAQSKDGGEKSAAPLFIRKSSLRDKKQWADLRLGSLVSLTLKTAAGRAIVSDAVLE